MTILSDALRQAFMPKHEYSTLREEDRSWTKLQRPFTLALTLLTILSVAISLFITLLIVNSESGKRPFCGSAKLNPISLRGGEGGADDIFPAAFYLTDQETVDYYWMVVFVPSAILFFASSAYLFAGIVVAYSAPARHGCLKVVENNYCASKRGGVRCLSVLNIVFAITFGLLALFLGSSLLTLGSGCSLPLFWCYEIATWGLVILYGGTAFFLRRKAAQILDESDFAGRNMGLELLEASLVHVTPEVERRVNDGFKSWMGSSLLSSDDEEEDEPDNYIEAPSATNILSSRQRV